MVGGSGPVGGILGLESVRRVRNNDTDARQEASRESATDVVCGLIDEAGELRLVGGVEEEEPEAVVCVHDLDLAEIVVPFQGEGVEDDVAVDEVRLVRAGELASGDVGVDAGSCFRGGDGDFKEL